MLAFQADADIPLPDEGRGAPADEASDIDSRNMSEASGAGEDGAQSALGSEGDEGEDLLDNAQACVPVNRAVALGGSKPICSSRQQTAQGQWVETSYATPA